MFWSGVLLTLALSVDGFVVGLLYGMRRIVLPWKSLGILGLCTACGMTVSMVFGGAVTDFISPHSAHLAGGVILVILGLWQLCQGSAEYVRSGTLPTDPGARPLLKLQVRPLGIIVHILVDPTWADSDQSGTIDNREAVALGAALGLDTLAAGFAAAMLGFGSLLIVAVTVALVTLVWLGMATGRRVGSGVFGRKGMFVPGALLILIGLLQM